MGNCESPKPQEIQEAKEIKQPAFVTSAFSKRYKQTNDLLKSRELQSSVYIDAKFRIALRHCLENYKHLLFTTGAVPDQKEEKRFDFQIQSPQQPRKMWVELQHRLLDWIGVTAQEIDITKMTETEIKSLLSGMRFLPKEIDLLQKEWLSRHKHNESTRSAALS